MSGRPPVAPRDEAFRREVHGFSTPDPYAWMARRDDPRLLANLVAERAFYDAATARRADLVAELRAEHVARMLDDGGPPPWRVGDFEYREHTPDGAEHPVVERRRAGEAEFAVILDGNAVAGGGPYLKYGLCEPSPDGRLLAYSVDVVGDEVYELRFRDLATGEDLADQVPQTCYGAAWSADSSAFCYVVHDEAYRPYGVLRHVVGADPTSDEVLFVEEDARFHVGLARSGAWIVVSSESCDTNEQWVVPADDPKAAARLVEPRRRGREYFVEDLGDGEFAVLTDYGAPEYQVMRVGVGEPGRAGWRPLVPGDAAVRIRAIRVVDGHLVMSCRSGGSPLVRVRRPDGSLFEVRPEVPGGVVELVPRAGLVVATEAVTMPPRRWCPDGSQPAESVESSPYVSERLWAAADDGTLIPITFVSRPELRGEGGSPCLLKVYGAYEACADGRYTPALLSLLDRGVVYAIAHVRGGGELGRRWWLDGRLAHKHHTFSDLLAVRDHLVAAGRVAQDGVVVRGLSAGGLVAGAVYTTHPEKWAGVIAEAPAVDLLNQMLDPRVPLTVNEYDEWGDPRSAEEFEWMRAYSPYENLSDRPRPPLLVTGILRDPRVQVSEPTKWVAALRALDTQGNDVLYRVELGAAAHRGPSGRTGAAAYEAEIQAWVLEVLKA